MNGLDTNVLVRFVMQDEPSQSARVDTIMNALTKDEPGWIGLAALIELVWVLTRVYRVERLEMQQILRQLLSRNEIVLEQAEVVRNALEIWTSSKVSFTDCLIATSARAAGCRLTFTFDQEAARTAGITLVP